MNLPTKIKNKLIKYFGVQGVNGIFINEDQIFYIVLDDIHAYHLIDFLQQQEELIIPIDFQEQFHFKYTDKEPPNSELIWEF